MATKTWGIVRTVTPSKGNTPMADTVMDADLIGEEVGDEFKEFMSKQRLSDISIRNCRKARLI